MALEKAEELAPRRLVADDGFFLAMAHWQLARTRLRGRESGARDKEHDADAQARHRAEARTWFEKSVERMEKGAGKKDDPDLTRFRAEAAALLGIQE
jgi:hypothetical protein